MKSKRWLAVAVAILVGGLSPAFADDDDERDVPTSFYLGLEFGGMLVSNAPSDYSLGLGRGFVFGYRRGAVSFEFLFGQSFSAKPSAEELEAANTFGSMSMNSAQARFYFGTESVQFNAIAGASIMSIPVLVMAENGVPEASDVAGIGGIAGAGVAIPLSGGAFQFYVDMRTAIGVWELPSRPYYTGVMSMNGQITAETTVDDADPILFTVVGGMRVTF